VACTQARISYNLPDFFYQLRALWLALRLGSVTIWRVPNIQELMLWLALRLGSVTISVSSWEQLDGLWLALRLGSVTIWKLVLKI